MSREHRNRSKCGVTTGKRYKNRDLNVCLTLNRLVSALDINVSQEVVERDLELILYRQSGLTMNSISQEMHTNYTQTQKVLSFLQSKGYVTEEKANRARKVKITKQGVLFIQRYNDYYVRTYAEIIQEHYRFGRLPAWFRAEV